MSEFDFSKFILDLALSLPGFMLAIVFHEAAHALAARHFGDDTAERMGRLSLNPLVHYDLVGTIIFPLVGIMAGWIPFGWAKPVPVDSRNFKNVKKAVFWVSFAGPLANIILACIGAFFLAILISFVSQSFSFFKILYDMLQRFLFINVILAVFNLIPFPPLDGSKMVATFLDYEMARKYEDLQRFSFIFLILLWTTNIFSYIVRPAVWGAEKLLYFFMMIFG